MGMDVSGLKPKNAKGEYFRANCWSWRPIHTIIAEVGKDLFTDKGLEALGYNDGAGLKTHDKCRKLADRIDLFMATHKESQTFGFNVNSHGTDFEYSVDRDHLAQFVEFLRNCGGFAVY